MEDIPVNITRKYLFEFIHSFAAKEKVVIYAEDECGSGENFKVSNNIASNESNTNILNNLETLGDIRKSDIRQTQFVNRNGVFINDKNYTDSTKIDSIHYIINHLYIIVLDVE